MISKERLARPEASTCHADRVGTLVGIPRFQKISLSNPRAFFDLSYLEDTVLDYAALRIRDARPGKPDIGEYFDLPPRDPIPPAGSAIIEDGQSAQ
jgi:hypothetical protein